MRLRLATWNLHRCIGRDGKMAPERCAEVLNEIDADIVALQEVDCGPGPALDRLSYLAEATGNRGLAGVAMVRNEADYGNALLTRLDVRDMRRHDLSQSGLEPRAALDVELAWNHFRIQIIATHLGLRPAERRAQVKHLLSFLDVQGHDLVMLAGDLNEWFLWGRPLRMLHRIFPDMPHRRTWPTRAPVFALDRIWIHPRETLCNLAVHDSALARITSDHLPLVADIELN